MFETTVEWKLYRDDRGYPRKTRSGHYRFDLVFKLKNGTPFASIIGLRLDYDRRRILPVQVQSPAGKAMFTVAEVAPECHQRVTDELCSAIAETFGWKDEAPYVPVKSHKVGCREFHLYKAEDCPCQKPNWEVPPIPGQSQNLPSSGT